MAGRTLAEHINDKICSLMPFVGHTRNGYCHQTFELIRASRRISAIIQDLDTAAPLEDFKKVADNIQKAVNEQCPKHSLKKATELLIDFCRNAQLSEENSAEKMKDAMEAAKKRDDEAENEVKRLRDKWKQTASDSSIFVTVTLSVLQAKKAKRKKYKERLSTDLPRDASLSFVLSLLVDQRRKTGITLEQGPNFYPDLKSYSELREITPLTLETHIFEVNDKPDKPDIRLSVLINNFGTLSVRGHDRRHHGITLHPIGQDEPRSGYRIVLKDVGGELNDVRIVLPGRHWFKDIHQSNSNLQEWQGPQGAMDFIEWKAGHHHWFLIPRDEETQERELAPREPAKQEPAKQPAKPQAEGWIPWLKRRVPTWK